MNTPETPIENLRSLLPKLPADSDFVPKYVELPAARQRAGVGNLRRGVLCLFLSLLLLSVGVFLVGAHAILPLLICLLACTLLWVIFRLGIFKERNGGFFALGLICLLGSAIAIAEWSYAHITLLVRNRAEAPAAPAQQVVAAPEIPAAVLPRVAAATPVPVSIPQLSQEVGIRQPDPIEGPRVEILNDQTVLVGRKAYQVRAGEVFELVEEKAGEVIVAAKELRISLPRESVKIAGVVAAASPVDERAPSPSTAVPSNEEDEDPVKVTKNAMQKAARRYPALATKDSRENMLFVETYRELKNTGSDMLKDAEWPIHLADSLAKREGWERKD